MSGVKKQETQVCKECGKELPLIMFTETRFGRLHTCRKCVSKKQVLAKAEKKKERLLEQEIEQARLLRLKDFTPRELMTELKNRGYEFTAKYTEVHVIDSKTL